MRKEDFVQGMKEAIPTALGYIGIGLACGVIAAPYLTPLEMLLMSLLVYAGSAQFAMIAMIAAGAGLLDMTVTVLLINLRLFLLSLHTTTIFSKDSLSHTMGIAILLTDETYGVLMGERARKDFISPYWMHGNNLLSYLSWAAATVVGAVLGGLLPNPEAFGLDFALVAMFIGIFTSQFLAMLRLEKLAKLLKILAAVTVSFFILTTVVTSSLAVLIATLIGCSVGVYLDGK